MKKVFIFVLFISIITSIVTFGAEDPWRFLQFSSTMGKERMRVEEKYFESDLGRKRWKFNHSLLFNVSHNALLHLNSTFLADSNTINNLKGGVLFNLGGVFIVGGEVSHSFIMENGETEWGGGIGPERYGTDPNGRDYNIYSSSKYSQQSALLKAGFGSYFTNNMWYFVGVFGINQTMSSQRSWFETVGKFHDYDGHDYQEPNEYHEVSLVVNEERRVKGVEAGILLGRAPESNLLFSLTGNYHHFELTDSSSDNSIPVLKNGSSWLAEALIALRLKTYEFDDDSTATTKFVLSVTYGKQDFEFARKQFRHRTLKSINAGFLFSF